jgi:NADH dehydrogenase
MAINMVTGAFSYTGKYITKRLLAMGEKVRTLTGHPDYENPLVNQIEIFPYHFDDSEKLIKNFQGVHTFYNSYWIRFPYSRIDFSDAVDNSIMLIKAAKTAGVSKIVHISITNADENSNLPYFKGKGEVEKFIKESGLKYTIIRPTVIFGKEDILINNIAWNIRKFPLFGVFGDGQYRIQPIYVEDLAEISIEEAQSRAVSIIDAAGPEIFTFIDLVRLIKEKIQIKSKIIHSPYWLSLAFAKLIGMFVGDVMITKDEVRGLRSNLLYSKEQPRGKTKLSSWLEKNSRSVGIKYSSELKRHYRAYLK